MYLVNIFSEVTDGGSALLLCSEEGLQQAGISQSDCVEIVGLEYGCGNLWEDAKDLAVMDTTQNVVSRLFAGTKTSIKDVNVAEVHDCFNIAELLMSNFLD